MRERERERERVRERERERVSLWCQSQRDVHLLFLSLR